MYHTLGLELAAVALLCISLVGALDWYMCVHACVRALCLHSFLVSSHGAYFAASNVWQCRGALCA